MSIETAGLKDEQFWGLDQEIEQIERMANVWTRQAEIHQSSPSGLGMEKIAAGYRQHLEILRAERKKNR